MLSTMSTENLGLPEDARPQQPLDLSHSPLQEWIVTLSSGEEMYILAADSMDAAYSALELSTDRHCKLLNVTRADEW